jgi:hypothetical protein
VDALQVRKGGVGNARLLAVAHVQRAYAV